MYDLTKINRLSDVVDRNFWGNGLFDDSFINHFNKSSTMISPKIRIEEGEDFYVVFAEIPGVSRENVDLRYEDSILTISAKINQEDKKKKEKVIFNEIRQTSFSRSIRLDGVDINEAQAKMKDGVLKIDLPKDSNSKVKKISIK